MEVVVGEGRVEAFGGEVEVGRECARCSEGRWCRRRKPRATSPKRETRVENRERQKSKPRRVKPESEPDSNQSPTKVKTRVRTEVRTKAETRDRAKDNASVPKARKPP